jgi:hypothetical protein
MAVLRNAIAVLDNDKPDWRKLLSSLKDHIHGLLRIMELSPKMKMEKPMPYFCYFFFVIFLRATVPFDCGEVMS